MEGGDEGRRGGQGEGRQIKETKIANDRRMERIRKICGKRSATTTNT